MENQAGRNQTTETGKENIRLSDRKGKEISTRYGRSVKMRENNYCFYTTIGKKGWGAGMEEKGGERCHFTIILHQVLFFPPLSACLIWMRHLVMDLIAETCFSGFFWLSLQTKPLTPNISKDARMFDLSLPFPVSSVL